MSNKPLGTPTAPERTGRARLLPLGPSGAVALIAAIATSALAIGVPAAWICPFAVSALLVAALLLARLRVANRRLHSVARALRASEYRHRRQYESVDAGVMTLEPDGRVASANGVLVAMLGFESEAALLGVDLGEQVFQARESLVTLLSRARREGETGAVELHLRRADGMPLIVAATLRAQWDDAGAIASFQLTLLDIGDLKFAERQRRSTERRFRRLFESNAAGIVFGNLRRGTLDEANARMRELAGLRAAELPVLLEAVPADGRPFLGTAIRAALESDGFAPPVETSYLRADGRRVATIVCATMIDSLQGDFVAIVVDCPTGHEPAVSQAVTERLHGSVLDALPEPIARFSREQRLTYCNAACRAWFGFPLTPTGISLRDLLGLAPRDSVADRVDEVLSGATVRDTIEVFQVGGRPHSLAIALSPHRRSDGTIAGIVAMMRDLTGAVSAADDGGLHTSADNTYRMSVP